MPTTNSDSYTAMSVRCTEETRDAIRDTAARAGRNSSDILREALKLWAIRANLKPRQALAIINRTTGKIECEVVLTPE